jgi:hypothetical protein
MSREDHRQTRNHPDLRKHCPERLPAWAVDQPVDGRHSDGHGTGAGLSDRSREEPRVQALLPVVRRVCAAVRSAPVACIGVNL